MGRDRTIGHRGRVIMCESGRLPRSPLSGALPRGWPVQWRGGLTSLANSAVCAGQGPPELLLDLGGEVWPLSVHGCERGGLTGREEYVTGRLIFPEIEEEGPLAGAVINHGVLETLGVSDFNFFDIHLHTVSGMLSTKKRELLVTPLGLAAQGRIPQALTDPDPANRRCGDEVRVGPDAGADRPEVGDRAADTQSTRNKARKSIRLPAASPGSGTVFRSMPNRRAAPLIPYSVA